MEMPDSRPGESLVLRAWLEDMGALRVRITRVLATREPTTVVSSSVEETCAIVRSWLGELLEAGNPGGRDEGLPPW